MIIRSDLGGGDVQPTLGQEQFKGGRVSVVRGTAITIRFGIQTKPRLKLNLKKFVRILASERSTFLMMGTLLTIGNDLIKRRTKTTNKMIIY